MFVLECPWALLIIILPILVMKLPKQNLVQVQALKIPFFKEIAAIKQSSMLSNDSMIGKILLGLIWLLLTFSLSAPHWVDEPIELPRKGRDILLAIDVSGSMEIDDMYINQQAFDRLTIVKKVANEFVDKRIGDRLGLILFGTKAYLQTPLTFDRKTVKHMINDSSIALAGPLTSIGDAIGLAVKRLRNIESQSKVVVLLTDGAHNSGEVDPIIAAQMAAKFDIKIYTIGLGSNTMKVPGLFGAQIINPSQDLDEKTLTQISKITKGVFFRATSVESLKEVYNSIDALEPNVRESGVFRPKHALFYYPLSIAFVLSLILFIRKNTMLGRWL